jgi:hypothetical protein
MFVVAEPLHCPLQTTLVCVPDNVNVPVDVTVTAMVDGGEQERASVTVHVYVPGQSPVAVAAVPPEGAQE